MVLVYAMLKCTILLDTSYLHFADRLYYVVLVYLAEHFRVFRIFMLYYT